LTIPLSPPTWQLTIARTPLVSIIRDPVGSGQGTHGRTAPPPFGTGETTEDKTKK